MAKQRLDNLLVARNFCASRQQAQGFIRAGEVKVNQQVIDKPGTEVDVNAIIEIKARSRFVSRGGEKLIKALEFFNIEVSERVCLDGGISTGGFTDCLLQKGAIKVYGIDVGYGQLDWHLRNDPRVIFRERTNLRYLTPQDLYGAVPSLPYEGGGFPDLGVVDVSFISLTKVLPALWELLIPPREMILLVKPQFEVGRDRVGKKGVVRNPSDHADAIWQVCRAADAIGWEYRGLTWSPIVGPAGNIEYLLWLKMNFPQSSDNGIISSIISPNQVLEITKTAYEKLATSPS